jgi:hypothetical protein
MHFPGEYQMIACRFEVVYIRLMISYKAINIYGFISIAIMLIMLVLIWTRRVPESLYLTLFLIALALFLIRIALRLILARQERLYKEEQEQSQGKSL